MMISETLPPAGMMGNDIQENEILSPSNGE